ncbi:hypothetical protein MTP99_007549 [Tenebrio molitor]|nr:hypothetical protein MTP99_007549 [Tenebrio molitor]
MEKVIPWEFFKKPVQYRHSLNLLRPQDNGGKPVEVPCWNLAGVLTMMKFLICDTCTKYNVNNSRHYSRRKF